MIHEYIVHILCLNYNLELKVNFYLILYDMNFKFMRFNIVNITDFHSYNYMWMKKQNSEFNIIFE